ncbi:MAG TPA: YfhO family protein, partial [Aggregatilinea sp.]|uniref:YfhO family protein n=1 Tax=Aggregatilinea sp. TaxID=2806333 RepID=UPI002CD0E04B
PMRPRRVAAVLLAVLPWLLRGPASGGRAAALVALVVFDLFSVTMGRNFESMPASDRLPQPEIVAWLDDHLPPGERIDARRGLRDNFGTLYDVPDIRGISPLRLDAIDRILSLPDDRAWDLLAVRYVLTDWNELMAPSTIAATDADPYGAYNVHELDAPRGFAHLTYGATVVGSDADAYGLLREPAYDTHRYAILDRNPGVEFPENFPDDPGSAAVMAFAPERITISAENPAPAVLTLALPDYPGWEATVDGADAEILRAYGGLSAVALPDAGAHTIELAYRPWSFRIGAILSIAAWLGAAAVAAWSIARAWAGRRETSREV